MSEYKFTDKNHPPVPTLKVGDRCYAHCPWGMHYDRVSTCEIRKVEVKWIEPNDYEKEHLGEVGHWYINYYIRTDVDRVGLKSTKMYAYRLGDDGREPDLYLTPQEVMDKNIIEFKKSLMLQLNGMRKEMKRLGYSVEQTNKLLEYKADGGE